MARPTYGQPNGVRLNPKQDERCRAAIQTTQLCKRLNMFALDMLDLQTGRKVEMSDTQVRAALGLLRKTLPDLAVTQLTGENGGALLVDFRWADAPVTQSQPPVADAAPAVIEDAEVVWSDSEC